ncbi:MAG: pectin esterase [Ignavibacteriaceae bacterium]|nr:pectin esterase [Ignavibacteriaceae bacterium]
MTSILCKSFLLSLFIFLPVFAKPDFIVAQDGSGDFTTIQSALNSIPDSSYKTIIIFIRNGLYKEKLFIEKSNVALVGENKDSTIIVFAELRKKWREKNPDDYGAGVVNIKNKVSDISFISLTIRNIYGSLFGDNDHQFAIRAGEGVTRIIIEDCYIIADGGDTVSLWNTDDGMYYHNNCFFEGYVDYVCPRGYCFIENSRFYGHNLTASIWHDGSQNKDHKFVLSNCYFDGVNGFPLGRFHRDAQFFLINCTFSENMADKKIFFAPSNPPRVLRWGGNRIYFYNCHREGGDFSWHQNNLELAEEKPIPEQINAAWVFNNKWNPSEVVSLIKKEFSKYE